MYNIMFIGYLGLLSLKIVDLSFVELLSLKLVYIGSL